MLRTKAKRISSFLNGFTLSMIYSLGISAVIQGITGIKIFTVTSCIFGLLLALAVVAMLILKAMPKESK